MMPRTPVVFAIPYLCIVSTFTSAESSVLVYLRELLYGFCCLSFRKSMRLASFSSGLRSVVVMLALNSSNKSCDLFNSTSLLSSTTLHGRASLVCSTE